MSPTLARLRNDLHVAMKARDELTVAALRLALTAVRTAEVATSATTVLSDDEVLGVLRAQVKARVEAAELYERADRPALAERERAQAAVVERYLPAELDDDALVAAVERCVARLGAAGDPKALGAVIAAVRAEVGVSASGARVASAVRAALS